MVHSVAESPLGAADAQWAARALRLLVEAGNILDSSAQLPEALTALGRLLVPEIADGALIRLIDPDSAQVAAEFFHVLPEQRADVEAYLTRYPAQRARGPLVDAVRSGARVLANEVSEEVLRGFVPDHEQYLAVRALGLRALLAVPLLARQRVVGSLSLTMSRSAREFTGPVVTLVEAIAARIAATVDNALLVEAERRRLAEAKWREEWSRFLTEATAVLMGPFDSDAPIARFAELAVATIADWCIVDLWDAAGAFRRIIRSADVAKAWIRQALIEHYAPDLSRPHPINHVVQSREPELVSPVTDEWIRARARDAEHARLLRAMQMTSLILVPLISRDRLLGVLTLVLAHSGRRYDPRDLYVARELGATVTTAVENAALYEALERELAVRRRTEAALRTSERIAQRQLAELEATYASAPVGLCVVDRDLRFVRINERLAEINGLPVTVHLSRRLSDVLPGLFPQLESLYNRALCGERVVGAEVSGETPAQPGVRRTWVVSIHPLRDVTGEVIGVGAAIEEITERQRAEEQLRQVAKMEAIGRLAGGLAHDFNNQLQALSGFADFIASEPGLSLRAQQDLSEIRKAADHMARLTQQLLAFSRQQVLMPDTVDLNAVVTDALPMLERLLGKLVTIRLELAPGAPWVQVDRSQLVQVLMNLVINARDAMPGGGEILVHVGVRDVAPGEGTLPTEAPVAPKRYAELQVTDYGVGIAPEDLPRIFEPFYTTKGAGKGTGLGLATVHGIVAQSRGYTWVESVPGRTTFTVLLPLIPG